MNVAGQRECVLLLYRMCSLTTIECVAHPLYASVSARVFALCTYTYIRVYTYAYIHVCTYTYILIYILSHTYGYAVSTYTLSSFYRTKETYQQDKRDLSTRQQRSIYSTKETYLKYKRDLSIRQDKRYLSTGTQVQ